MPGAGRAPTGDGLLRESTAGWFQGQRGSPDGGQGGAKLVGNRRQEGVLLLVQGSQPSGGLTLGHGVVGDVDIHPLPVAGLAAVVVDKLGFVTEPDRGWLGSAMSRKALSLVPLPSPAPLICELLMVRVEGSPMREGVSSDPLTLS